MRPVRLAVLVLLFWTVALGSAFSGSSPDDPIVVIEVGDPMDQRSIDFVIGAIRDTRAHFFILKIDSPGVSSGDVSELYEALDEASAPVVAWIGPQPAVAFGGSAFLANHADIRSAAPGVEVGYLEPAVQRSGEGPSSVREGDDLEAFVEEMSRLGDTAVTVTPEEGLIVGFVDRVDPALGQLIVSLDGVVVTRGSLTWELSTARIETVDGQGLLVATRSVEFMKPGILDRFLRLGARPETAFLFLLIGLSFAVFELFAAGRGLMAAVASTSFIVAGYGLATLPMWWPSIAIMVVGFGLLVWGFAQNRVDWRAVAGSILLLVAGFTFTTSRPAYPPAMWMVVLAVAGTVLFVWYSLTTVVRGRFATPTVGREELIGTRCLAVSDLDPEGVVVVDGARWRATADRGVTIGSGAVAEIVGVTGLVLEVGPVVRSDREELS